MHKHPDIIKREEQTKMCITMNANVLMTAVYSGTMDKLTDSVLSKKSAQKQGNMRRDEF